MHFSLFDSEQSKKQVLPAALSVTRCSQARSKKDLSPSLCSLLALIYTLLRAEGQTSEYLVDVSTSSDVLPRCVGLCLTEVVTMSPLDDVARDSKF